MSEAAMLRELLLLIKHDCETCCLVLPALERAARSAAGLRILSQSSRDQSDALSARLGLEALELDNELATSERFAPDAVPALILLEDDRECDRIEGFDRASFEKLASAAGIALDLHGLPDRRPGCASRTRDPDVEAGLAARRARREGRIRSRSIRISALEDPFEAMDRLGVTDGLPVVPPTPERVVAMLTHTSRDPQEVVGVLPPYQRPATIEKAAINAVMAGCPGPAFPIVLAALDAVGEESFSLQGVIATTNPVGPLLVVSGPIAAEVGMNSGGNCLGQGNRANLSIGRALQLTLRNVGGGIPGRDDRATLGQMGKVGACFAERTADSPWDSLAAERGVPQGSSGVTLFAAEGPRVVPDPLSRTPESLAASLGMAVDALYHPKQRNLLSPLVILPPSCAQVFGRSGWSKQRVKKAIWERSKRPAADLAPGARGCEVGADAALLARDDGGGIAKVESPNDITIVHAGGDVGSMAMLIAVFPANERGAKPATRCVEDWR
jgi:hypothetical protein